MTMQIDILLVRSSRRARLDEAERARRSLENRFRTAVSPHSAFPQPRPSLTDKVTSTEPIQADKETTADIDILGVSTNDAVTGRRLLAHRPLPYGSFKTVSLLLESPKDREAKDLSVYVTAHDMPPFPTRLQPFAPYDTEESPLKAAPDLDNQEERGKGEEVEPAVRLPPVQFRSHVDTVKGPLERPFHHPGIAWPLAVSNLSRLFVALVASYGKRDHCREFKKCCMHCEFIYCDHTICVDLMILIWWMTLSHDIVMLLICILELWC